MPSKMYNRARMTVTSTGTGALSLGIAVAGYQTFSSAGAQNNDTVSYTIEDGLNWEIGTGTFNATSGTLSRTVTQSYDGSSYGTTAISVTTNAQVYITALAADIVVSGGALGTPASGNLSNCTFPTLNQNTTGTAAGLSSTLSVSSGGTGLTSLDAGRIPYGAGTGAFGNSANLFWDAANNRLGIGTATPSGPLQIGSTPSLLLNASGNLGLGVSPSAWSIGKAVEVGAKGSAFWTANAIDNYILCNAYYDGNFKYGASAAASGYEQISGAHRWFTAASGTAGNAISFTQAMTLDASGNWALGATDTSQKRALIVETNNTTGVTYGLKIGNYSFTTDTRAGIVFINADNNGAAIWGRRTGGFEGNLVFGTNSGGGIAESNITEKARIDSSGNLLVGTTTAYGKLGAETSSNGRVIFAFSTASSGYTDAMLVSEFRNYAPNNATARFLYCGDTNTGRCIIYSNGGIGNYQANDSNFSDARLKKNITNAEDYLSKIIAIPIKTFLYKDQADDELNLGVIAQDVLAVAPELVNKDGKYLAIYQTDLQYALMKCIQELAAKVTALEAANG